MSERGEIVCEECGCEFIDYPENALCPECEEYLLEEGYEPDA